MTPEDASIVSTGSLAETAPGSDDDMKALTEAFRVFTETTASMEESYKRLEARVQSLDRELQEKNQELAFTTEYLNSILNSMSDGVIALDNEGLVTTFNRAAEQTLGFARDQVLGKPYPEVFGAEPRADQGQCATELRASNENVIPVSEKCSPIADRRGHRIGTLHVFQDLREIEALREEVRRKDRLAAVGQMAATVAHEIRNPLGGIRGFAALLARDLEGDEDRLRLVNKILDGTASLDSVVTGLLEYTRPIELVIASTNCRELVDAAIGYLGRAHSEIRITNAVDPQTAVRVDALKMRQALLNVLLNAVQSIDGEGAVTVTSSVDAGEVTLSITDTGCGIAVENIDKVFSPFFTTKEKGTGLGLAVAAKTIETHGGSIEVANTAGPGSTFRIQLAQAEA